MQSSSFRFALFCHGTGYFIYLEHSGFCGCFCGSCFTRKLVDRQIRNCRQFFQRFVGFFSYYEITVVKQVKISRHFTVYKSQCSLDRVYNSLAALGHVHCTFLYELVQLYNNAVVTNLFGSKLGC